MKILTVVFSAIILISCSVSKTADYQQKINIKEMVSNPETILVDVRIKEEFETETVPNAKNIPLAEIENNLNFFKNQKQVVLFCNRGKQADEAIEILKKKGIHNVYDGTSLKNIQAIQNEKIMNLLENIEFSTEKPNVVPLANSDKMKYFAVALGKGAILKKHITATPAKLVMLKGEINFIFEDREFVLKQFDTFEIPANVSHEVLGLSDKNLFTLTKEL